MDDITNQDRALWAEAALGAFVEQIGQNRIDACAICDLVANLGHYADEQGYDFLAAVRSGIGHWKAEAGDTANEDMLPAVSIIIDGGSP